MLQMLEELSVSTVPSIMKNNVDISLSLFSLDYLLSVNVNN